MRLNFDTPLLDKLNEGVILLDRQATVVAHNRAAQPWVARCNARANAIKALIAEEVSGHLGLPIRMESWKSGTAEDAYTVEPWLMRNGRRDYALLMLPKPGQKPVPKPRVDAAERENNYVSLLGEDVRIQMALPRELMQPTTPGEAHEPSVIAEQSILVDRILQEICDLSTVMQRDQMYSDDRLVLPELVRNILPTLIHAHDTIELIESDASTGMVYGHAHWLEYALRTLLESLVSSAPDHSHIRITTRQIGNYIVLAGGVTVGMPKHQKPVHVAVPSESQTSAVAKTSTQHRTQIQQIMCRRIIALHAGQLKLTFMPDAVRGGDSSSLIETFTLTLPTGLPLHERSRASCTECRINLQTQAFAADVATLLSKNNLSL